MIARNAASISSSRSIDLGGRGGVEPREGVERHLQHVARARRRRGRRRSGARGAELVGAADPRRLVGDLLHLVADALELVDDLGDHQHEAQVDRRRLPSAR